MLVFPRLYFMLKEVETKRIHGCQVLDYFSKYDTGVPVMKTILERYKQCYQLVQFVE